jgi:hypothetical protein
MVSLHSSHQEVDMAFFSLFRIAAAVLLFGGASAAAAQTPREIQAQIANGQAGQALTELNQILQAHPHSGVAWYLAAEAQDALGNEDAARSDLAAAQQDAPNLPFAKPDDVAALQAHLEGAAHHGGGGGHVLFIIAVLFGLFILIRVLLRARRPVPMGYGEGYGGGGFPGQPGYPPAPGGGLGSSLISGLAAGAGFAAGERIIDDVMGNRFGEGGQNFDSAPPARDDGLSGSPGWDDGQNDNSDSNDNW